jgi:Holliday junction resolvasome RuvABC ATP-dependent DNA helicase subunit
MSNIIESSQTNHELALSKLVNGIFPELFSDYIGQTDAKKRFEFYLRSYLKTRHIPNSLITSQKGNGKTALARIIAKGLLKFDANGELEFNQTTQKPARKKLIEINCSNLSTVNDFLATWIVPYVQDKDVTVFFDEASEIPHSVTMALLTIMNPNQTKTQYSYGDYTVDFDFTRQSFLFATSEPQSVFHALLDRLKRVDLSDYSKEEIAKIIQIGAKGVEFETSVLEEIASVSRGNARNAQDYASEVKTYLGKESGSFSIEDWNELKSILSIAPLGLNVTEISILKHLREVPDGTSLTALAAKLGLSRESVQRDYELYLMKNELITVEAGKGRVITARGCEYLKNLK